MFESPQEQKAKLSAKEVLKLKHEETLARKAQLKENKQARLLSAQAHLSKAEQNYFANPTYKTYSFWKVAARRAQQ